MKKEKETDNKKMRTLKNLFEDYIIGDKFKDLAFSGETKHPKSKNFKRIWFIFNDGTCKIFDLSLKDASNFIKYANERIKKKNIIVEELKNEETSNEEPKSNNE